MKNLILAAAGVLLIVAFSCSNEGGGFFAKFLKGGGSAVPVTVESVVLEERTPDISVPAVLETADSIEVASPEEAVIEQVLVTDGALVNADDALVKLSEQDVQFRLSKLRSDLKDAKATLEKNTYLFKNRDRLYEEGKIDRGQYDNLEAEVQSNEAAAEKIQQSVTKMEERAGPNTITSPISGVVGKISVAAGSQVTAGRMLMTVSKSDPIYASFKLSSANAKSVRAGMVVKVRLLDLGGEDALARIMNVGTELDPADNTFGVRAAISNPAGHLKAGMRAEVVFTSSDRQRIFIISEDALIRERRAYFVFTVVKGVAHKVQVIPNETVGSRVEIQRGLNEDDIVVVKGHNNLAEGTVVDIWGR